MQGSGMPSWSTWVVSSTVSRESKVGSRDASDALTTEYVHITCPFCEYRIESTKHSVSKNKSLLCRSHLAKCTKRPSDGSDTASRNAVDQGSSEGQLDLPPSKKQRLAVVQHRDCIARERKFEERLGTVEARLQLIENTIVSHVPGVKIPLECEQLVLALDSMKTVLPHPRIEEVTSTTSIVPTNQQQHHQPLMSVSDLASEMLPSLERAMIQGLVSSQNKEKALFCAQQAINSMQSRLETLQKNFDHVLKEKEHLVKKLNRVARGDTEYILQLQGRRPSAGNL